MRADPMRPGSFDRLRHFEDALLARVPHMTTSNALRRISWGPRLARIAVIALAACGSACSPQPHSGADRHAAAATPTAKAHDPLPSWNEGRARAAILSLVERTTTPGSPDFVPVAERIAVFDNDGTLWSEQPMYVQLAFAIDRVKALAPQHPEWATQEPFASILRGDAGAALAGGERAVAEIVMATHAGMTTEEFEAIVKAWLDTARHPRTGRPYTEMVYQPMVELLAYLRANGFQTFIVSGGGIDFMRPWTERVYGVPPERVVGSSLATAFEHRDGTTVLVRQPKIAFIDDKAGKPVGIESHIGRRPILAFGNSTGDREMLEYTTIGRPGARLGVLVLHDDGVREVAYGPAEGLPNTHIGTFTQSLYDEALRNGWVVVRMKDDWRTVFPARSPGEG